MDAEKFDTVAVIIDPDELTAAAHRWLAVADQYQQDYPVAEMLTSLARKWLEA
jgi:hypothetical protein